MPHMRSHFPLPNDPPHFGPFGFLSSDPLRLEAATDDAGGGGEAADLVEEEREILLDPSQKKLEVAPRPNIGRVARLERGAVIAQDKDLMPAVFQECPREPNCL